MDIYRFCGQLNEKPRRMGTILICFFFFECYMRRLVDWYRSCLQGQFEATAKSWLA